MRILQINANYGFGSTGVIVEDIGKMLVRNGQESFVAYQKTNQILENSYKVGNSFDWKIHAAMSRVLGKQGYYSAWPTKKLIAYIDSIHPDVVHLHNVHSNYVHLNKLLDYLAKKDIPTVITMHDCWYFTGKCFHYVDANCDRFITGCGNCPKKNAPPASMLFDRSDSVIKDRYKYISAIPRLRIVGCSEWICGEARKGIFKDFELCTIHNGVDTDIFKPYDKQALKKEQHLDGKYIIMGMANKWTLPSNSDVLEKTVNALDENSMLMIVGCDSRQIEYLDRYKEKVLKIGFVHDRQRLGEYYSMADIFVNTTRADTLPTVNMESICCGTPVITYDSCGSPELILDGCGLVVAENDADAIVEAVKKARHMDFSMCSEIGQAAFDKNICYGKYLDVYREVQKLEKEDNQCYFI